LSSPECTFDFVGIANEVTEGNLGDLVVRSTVLIVGFETKGDLTTPGFLRLLKTNFERTTGTGSGVTRYLDL
jgi:hypothetical protein